MTSDLNFNLNPHSSSTAIRGLTVFSGSEVTTGGCEVTDGGIVAARGNKGNYVTGTIEQYPLLSPLQPDSFHHRGIPVLGERHSTG